MTARASRPDRPGVRLTGLVVVLAVFFALPAVLFLRLAGTIGSTRLAVQVLMLTLPATGALVLHLNPDLVPDRAGLRAVSTVEWIRAVLLAGLLVGGAWWLAGAVLPR